jgi:hypothetical protein
MSTVAVPVLQDLAELGLQVRDRALQRGRLQLKLGDQGGGGG